MDVDKWMQRFVSFGAVFALVAFFCGWLHLELMALVAGCFALLFVGFSLCILIVAIAFDL